MSVFRKFLRALVTAVPVVALSAPAAFAQDVNAMAKWTSLTIVHYRIVGEYSGETEIFAGKQQSRKGRATDRYEIEFDWNQQETKLAGKAVFKNAPTTFIPNPIQGCPAIRLEGTRELVTILSIKDAFPGYVTIEFTREFPGGAVPWTDDETKPCGSNWDQVPPKSETTELALTVPAAMMLAMPGAMQMTPDGKSLVLKGEKGWTWTFTPTPVK